MRRLSTLITAPLRRVRRSMDSLSRNRKPASPSFSKMKAMSTPVRASTSASLSWKENRNRRARWRPTADLPEPMGPIRKMLGWESMEGKDTETAAPERTRPPEGGRAGRCPSRNQVIVTGIEYVVVDFDSGEVTVTVIELLPALAGAVRVMPATPPPTVTSGDAWIV